MGQPWVNHGPKTLPHFARAGNGVAAVSPAFVPRCGTTAGKYQPSAVSPSTSSGREAAVSRERPRHYCSLLTTHYLLFPCTWTGGASDATIAAVERRFKMQGLRRAAASDQRSAVSGQRGPGVGVVTEVNEMAREFCPKCQTIRNMQVSQRREKEIDPDGRVREVVKRIYQCETCNSFVRTETITELKDKPSDEHTSQDGA